MEVFVRAVELGGFSAAARALRLTPSAVSKLVARLEARLGARLLDRSTRKLRLTGEGAVFFERSKRILDDIDAAERDVAPGETPRGRLRVSANVPFGLHRLLPLVPRFLTAYPRVTLDITLSDVVVDLVDARTDIAIRTGPLRASRLRARKLGDSRMHLVAAPSYLRAHGKPRTVEDLSRHNCLGFCFTPRRGWPLAGQSFMPSGNALVADGESMRTLVLAGLGIARLAAFHIGPDIEAGRLVPVLDGLHPADSEPVHAVFLGEGATMPTRTRVFLDYLAAESRI